MVTFSLMLTPQLLPPPTELTELLTN
jgi:hypothetical protein